MMRKQQVWHAGLLIVCLFMAGCSSVVEEEAALDLAFFESGEALTFHEIKSSFVTLEKSSAGNSDLAERRNLVLRDQEALADFWQRLHANQESAPELPAVDFEQDMVIAVMLGRRNTGGYSVEVKKIVSNEGQVGVLVEETAPGSSCATYQALTSPYHIIKMASSPGPFSFVDTKQVHACE